MNVLLRTSSQEIKDDASENFLLYLLTQANFDRSASDGSQFLCRPAEKTGRTSTSRSSFDKSRAFGSLRLCTAHIDDMKKKTKNMAWIIVKICPPPARGTAASAGAMATLSTVLA